MGGVTEVAFLLGSMAAEDVLAKQKERAEIRALEERRTQEELKSNEEAIQREKKVRQVLGVQRAEGAARGVEPTSASLSAISTDTFNEFAEDEKAANLNLQMRETDIDIEEENSKRNFESKIFGNLFSAANRYASFETFAGKKPSKDTGFEFDSAVRNPKVDSSGPLDLKKYNQHKINEFWGF